MGWMPLFNGANNLVWDSTRGRLWFVGFRSARKLGPADAWKKPETLASWGLIKRPQGANRKNIKKWEW